MGNEDGDEGGDGDGDRDRNRDGNGDGDRDRTKMGTGMESGMGRDRDKGGDGDKDGDQNRNRDGDKGGDGDGNVVRDRDGNEDRASDGDRDGDGDKDSDGVARSPVLGLNWADLCRGAGDTRHSCPSTCGTPLTQSIPQPGAGPHPAPPTEVSVSPRWAGDTPEPPRGPSTLRSPGGVAGGTGGYLPRGWGHGHPPKKQHPSQAGGAPSARLSLWTLFGDTRAAIGAAKR